MSRGRITTLDGVSTGQEIPCHEVLHVVRRPGAVYNICTLLRTRVRRVHTSTPDF